LWSLYSLHMAKETEESIRSTRNNDLIFYYFKEHHNWEKLSRLWKLTYCIEEELRGFLLCLSLKSIESEFFSAIRKGFLDYGFDKVSLREPWLERLYGWNFVDLFQHFLLLKLGVDELNELGTGILAVPILIIVQDQIGLSRVIDPFHHHLPVLSELRLFNEIFK
jgi:hypothetical protein